MMKKFLNTSVALALAIMLSTPLVSKSQNQVNDTYTLERLMAMQDIMLGEIAWQRGMKQEAINYYQLAIKEYPDAKVAERATELAFIANLNQADELAVTWANLSPKSNQAQISAIALKLKNSSKKEIYPFLSNLYQTQGTEEFTQSMLIVLSKLTTNEEKIKLNNILSDFLSKQPKSKDTEYLLAITLSMAGEKDNALKNIENLLTDNPNDLKALLLYLELLPETNKKDKGIIFLNELTKTVNDPNAKFIIGKFLAQHAYYQQANKLLSSLLTNDSFKEEASLYLAIIAANEQNFKKAENLFTKLINSELYSDAALYYLGELYTKQGNLDKASKTFEQVGHGYYYLNAQINSAKILAKTDSVLNAINKIKDIIPIFPDHEKELIMAAIYISLEYQEYKQAILLLTETIEQNPNDIDYVYARGLIAAKINDIKTSEEDLLHIINIDPYNYEALNALGFTLADKTNRFGEAESYITKAMNLSPDNPAILDSMGWLQYKIGDKQSAIAYLEKAFKLSNYDTEIAAHLGEVLWESGNIKLAKSIWQKASLDAPQNELLQKTIKKYQNN